jgi:adenosylcobinamide-phosphate synthase
MATFPLLVAFILDLLLGDPRRLPHPVVGIGRLVSSLETWLYDGCLPRRQGGLLLVLSTLVVVASVGWFGLAVAGSVHSWLGHLLAIWLGYSCLALRELHKQSQRVVDAVAMGDLVEARGALAMIVGRETTDLDEQGVLRACVETVAENTSDALVAPLIYLGLFGPLGGLLYKAINTMDSMIGYRNERYQEFGWAAAKLDDWANWLPARLTGFLLVLVSGLLGLNGWQSWRVMLRDARKHDSPNAGYPEAAAAGALGVQLGGPAQYFGEQIDKPTFGDADRALTVELFRKMVYLMYGTALMALVAVMAVSAWLH